MKKKALVTIVAIAVCLIGAWQLIGMHDGNNPARDLQEEEATGGMTVTLQISVADIVRSKAANPQDAKLNEALAYASENPENDFVGVFCKKYEELVPGVSLAQKFNRVDGVNANDGNSTVEGILREKTRSDISKSVDLLRERFSRFGMLLPSIENTQREGRILMKLPGVKEPERVHKLIQSSAKLEFYETYTVDNALCSLLAELSETAATQNAEGEQSGKTLAEMIWSDALVAVTTSGYEGTKDVQIPASNYIGGACIGVANEADTAAVNRILASPMAKKILPSDLKCRWSVKGIDKKDSYFQLVALRTSNGEAALSDADMIDDASAELNQFSGSYEVSMTMNSDAAAKWAKVTRDNVGKQVAIVLDDQVYSFPTVNTPIEGGRSSITGNFTVEEAKEIAKKLKAGSLPFAISVVGIEVNE